MDTSKIIIGVVNNRNFTTTAPIIKEDYGLNLKIEGVELPETYQVDFSNSEDSGTSVTMIGNSDGVLIPRQFISSGKDVFAFLYHVGADFGRTVYKFRIPNKLRPDRTDETPTPEEQSTIDQAISALNSAMDATAQNVTVSATNAQSALNSAFSASADADRAEQARDDAQTYANNASASASQASTSATASAQSASDAETARQATTSLVAEAQGYANASAQSAQASAQSASQAQQFAQTASLEAESAQDSATQADISANTASAKASEASTSASTASAKATEASQSASQALGYKTDAESAKTASQTAQGLAEDAQTAAETAQGLAEDARDEAQNLVDGISGKVEQIDSNTERIESLEDDRYKPYVVDSASGSIASFPDGADNIPLKSLVVDINPVQDLSNGDPSPENICPISGWTGVDVVQYVVNQWDEEWEVGGISGTNGSNIDGADRIRSTNYIKVIPGKTYYFKAPNSLGLRWYDTDKNYIGYSVALNIERTAPDNAHYMRFILLNNTTYNHNVSINYPSTDHDYHPYTGRSITIDLGQTVYGGKLDVLTGILTVYPEYDSYNGETLTGRWISDRDVYVAGTTPTIGAQVVNIGAEGTEIQLTPHEVNSLLGVNNIFADTGDTEVEYRADTKLYIERLTEPDADMIADSNIVSGQYFMVGNSLYLATANIASGAQVIVGTNATRKSLSEALNEINA